MNPRIKEQRRRSWAIWSIAFLCLSFIFYQKKDLWLTYYFLVFGILCIFFYPLYSRWYYKRHYRKHIEQTYKSRFGKEATVTIDNEYIHELAESGESKIPASEMEKV